MERLTEYIEINFKLAYKSVTFHFKQFIWFYIAIFIVQTLLGVTVISSDINQRNISTSVEQKYNSHMVFYYMNTNQKYYLKKASNYVFDDDYLFDIVTVKEYGEEKDRNYKCDVYIKFSADPNKGMETFTRKYLTGLEELGSVYYSSTPLFERSDSINSAKATYNFYLLIISILSFILLAILYNIRSNNYRFDYGIYMAFGADKKKLLNTCFWEMTVIAILTFLPALVFSSIFNYVMAQNEGIVFVLKILSCLKILLITFVLNCLSVVFTVVKTAIKNPISLILSQDNSNLVFSPRRSVDFLKNKSLSKLKNLSMLRYCKYYTVMVLSGILLSSIFVCGVYCSELYSSKQSNNEPQFEVTFSGSETYTEDDKAYFSNFKGITGTYKECSTSVTGLSEHILVNRDNTLPSALRVAYDEEYVAMDNGTSLYSEKANAIVTANQLNVRKSPSITAEKVGTLSKNQRVEVLETNGDWIRTNYGWVNKNFVKLVGSASVNNTGTVLALGLNVRSGPGTNYSKVAVLRLGEKVTILENQGNWMRISSGWVSADYIKIGN